MNEKIKEDILSVLEQVLGLLSDGDHHALSGLSNHVIHNASVYQDEDSLSIAVLVYAMSKIAQACCEKGISMKEFVELFRQARDFLKKDDYGSYKDCVKKLFTSVRKVDARMSTFIEEVIDKAKIKKGSKIHEHGISIARTAELLGITQWELMQYVGVSQEHGIKGELPTKKRLGIARQVFG